MGRSTAFLEAAGEAWLLHLALRLLAILALVALALRRRLDARMMGSMSYVDATAAVSRIGAAPLPDWVQALVFDG